MSEQRWRRPEPGTAEADTATLPAYSGDLALTAADGDRSGDPAGGGDPGDVPGGSGDVPGGPGDHSDLAGDHSDLAAELAAAAPRRWWNKATVYLGAAVLLVGGFVAGAQVQQAYGTPSSPAGARNANGANARAGGGGLGSGLFGGGNFGGQRSATGQTGGQQGQQTGGQASSPAAAAPTTGKVKLVDGTTVYVETADGDVVTVRTNGQTKVQSASPSSLKSLAPGDPVTVQGSASGDGTVTATTVTETK